VRYPGAYAVVLVLHLLTVAFAVGPSAVAASVSLRHVRARRAEALRDTSRTTRLYTLATLLTVVLGSALVGISGGTTGTPQWSMGQLWVSLSYVLWLVAVALLLLVVVPSQAKAAGQLEAGQDASGLAGRIGAAGGIAMLCWTVVIVLMVFKPGA